MQGPLWHFSYFLAKKSKSEPCLILKFWDQNLQFQRTSQEYTTPSGNIDTCEIVKYSIPISIGPWPNKLVTKIHTKHIVLLLVFLPCYQQLNWAKCVNYLPQWWVELDDELSWLFTNSCSATRYMKVKRIKRTEVLRRIWLFSANEIEEKYEFVSKQPTQLIIELNSLLRQIIDTKETFLATAKKARDSMRMQNFFVSFTMSVSQL